VSIQRALFGWALVGILALAGCSDELAVPTEPLRMLRTDFPIAYIGEQYEAQLRPSGGLRPYRFRLQDGALPPGLELSAGGVRGTPTEVGSYSFSISVRDGNLSTTVQQLTLEVRPLPEPVVRLDAPGTELREPVTLTLRIEDARGWRGTRVALRYDASLFELAETPSSSHNSIALFSDSESEPGLLLLEMAALGGSRSGAFDLARITFAPLEPPARLSLSLTSATRYSGGEQLTVRQEGAPPPERTATPIATPAPEEGAPEAEAEEGAPDAPAEEDANPPEAEEGENGTEEGQP
jgi:hypothetical protein